ncbi:MAG: phosphate acyltransferase PlsX [Clostridia bacterium]|nr:phosphate acyltransferase PlsX [Clostridia bacterium]
MKIYIDAMGGDNAPLEIVKGVCEASLLTDSTLVLVGRETEIKEIMGTLESRSVEVVDADEVITMEDDPLSVVRSKKNSSTSVGLRLLKEDGDAFVSAGNTGALHAGATLITRNIRGVRCAAIGTVLPLGSPVLLLDSGANVNVTPDNLVQWAKIGSEYVKKVVGIERPRVGLLNNGTEEHKGTPLQVEAYKLLSADAEINFVGNVEGKAITKNVCDVLVTDGFTGNVLLKTIEGVSSMLLGELKTTFYSSAKTKLAGLLMKKHIGTLKAKFDSSEYGGAPILGISKPVIKAHGSSCAKDIVNAIRQAEKFAASGMIGTLTEAFAKKKEENNAEQTV